MKLVPAYDKHQCTTQNLTQLDRLMKHQTFYAFVANIPSRPQHSSVTRDKVRIVK